MSLLRDARLRAFHTVAVHRSFTGAARHLLLSQQAVSFQIKSLEDEIGGQLFRRELRAAELTELGRILFGHAERILSLYGEAEAELAELTGELRGRLRVSATNSLAKYVLPQAIGAIRTQYPDIKVTMEVGNSDYTLGCIRDGLADVAFVSDGPAGLANYRVDPLFRDEIAFIIPPGHRWCTSAAVSFEDFCAAPIILREEGSGTRALLERAFADRGVTLDRLNVVLVLGSAEAVKGAVEAGAGVGMVSRLSMRRELAAGSLAAIHVRDFELVRDFYVVRPANRSVHRRVDHFIGLVRTAVPASA